MVYVLRGNMSPHACARLMTILGSLLPVSRTVAGKKSHHGSWKILGFPLVDALSQSHDTLNSLRRQGAKLLG